MMYGRILLETADDGPDMASGDERRLLIWEAESDLVYASNTCILEERGAHGDFDRPAARTFQEAIDALIAEIFIAKEMINLYDTTGSVTGGKHRILSASEAEKRARVVTEERYGRVFSDDTTHFVDSATPSHTLDEIKRVDAFRRWRKHRRDQARRGHTLHELPAHDVPPGRR